MRNDHQAIGGLRCCSCSRAGFCGICATWIYTHIHTHTRACTGTVERRGRRRRRRELPGASFLDTPPITPVSRGSASRRGAYNLFSPDKLGYGATRRVAPRRVAVSRKVRVEPQEPRDPRRVEGARDTCSGQASAAQSRVFASHVHTSYDRRQENSTSRGSVINLSS